VFGTEFSELDMQFELTSSIRNDKINMEMELVIECFRI